MIQRTKVLKVWFWVCGEKSKSISKQFHKITELGANFPFPFFLQNHGQMGLKHFLDLLIFEFVKYLWSLRNFELLLEIKPCGLGSRIRDVEAFWNKTEIKIIYFVRLCVIVWFTLTLNFWYVKLKNGLIFFSGWSLIFFDPMLSPKTFATNSLK